MANYINPVEIYGEAVRQFVSPFRIALPSGLVLLKGINRNTGDTSDAGKTSLLQVLPHIFGGGQYSTKDMQSWHTKTEYVVGTRIQVNGDTIRLERSSKGLLLDVDGVEHRGKAAEELITRIFGNLDANSRFLVTYRPQGSIGSFLGMSDTEKKNFLTKLLSLGRYEHISLDAAASAKRLLDEVEAHRVRLDMLSQSLANAKKAFEDAQQKLADHDNNPRCMPCERQAIEAELASLNAQYDTAQESLLKARQNLKTIIDSINIQKSKIQQEAVEKLSAYQPDNSGFLEVQAIDQKIAEIEAILKNLRAQQVQVEEKERKRKSEYDTSLSLLKERLASAVAAKNEVEKLRVEIDCLNDSVRTLDSQIGSLEKSVCYVCHRTWIDDEAMRKLAEIRQERLDKVEQIKNKSALSQEAQGIADRIPLLQAQLDSFPPFEIDSSLMEMAQKYEMGQRQLYDMQKAKAALLQNLQQAELKRREDFMKEVKAEADAKISKITAVNEVSLAQQAVSLAEENFKKVENAIKETKERLQRLNEAESLAKASRSALEAIFVSTKEALEVAEKAYQEAADAYEAIRKKYSLEETISRVVGYHGFLGSIFDDILSEISDRVNSSLSQVANTRTLTFQFASEFETSAGNVKKRIVPIIFNNGRKVTIDSGISGGMQSAVNLAVDLAVGAVVASRRGVYPGWMILDEAFNGLGDRAKESCMELLASYADDGKTIIVVDHSTTFTSMFSQVIQIETVDGRASLV